LNHPTQIINPETNAIEIHEHHGHRHWHMADGTHVTEHTNTATHAALGGDKDAAEVPAAASATTAETLAARAEGGAAGADVDEESSEEPQVVSDIVMSPEDVTAMEQQKELQAELAAAEANYFATGESDVSSIEAMDAANHGETPPAEKAAAEKKKVAAKKAQAAKAADAAPPKAAAAAAAAAADADDDGNSEKRTGAAKKAAAPGIGGMQPMKLFMVSLLVCLVLFALFVIFRKRQSAGGSTIVGTKRSSAPASPEDPGAVWVDDLAITKPNVSIL
jgi:hypothetical protein